MNRAKAIELAMEMQPAPGWTEALSKAYKIPAEPEYQRRCAYCVNVVEDGQLCCGEVHSELQPECPQCGDDIEWVVGTTSCGIEAHTPKCTHCEWEGDPQ